MTESGTPRVEQVKLMCLDVVSWRIPSKEELRAFRMRMREVRKSDRFLQFGTIFRQ
jgi:hypothetical protein